MYFCFQMSLGRRTSSMKASYDLMTKNLMPKELSLALNNTPSSAPSTPETAPPRTHRPKK